MTENGLFILGGLDTQLHDILWAVHDRKNRGRSEGEENIREFLLVDVVISKTFLRTRKIMVMHSN